MTGPTISYANLVVFADLTTNPVNIAEDSAWAVAQTGWQHTVRIGGVGDLARLDLYLAPGSLEALRDAITTHLESSS